MRERPKTQRGREGGREAEDERERGVSGRGRSRLCVRVWERKSERERERDVEEAERARECTFLM